MLSRKAIDRLALTENDFAIESEMQFEAAVKGLRFGKRQSESAMADPREGAQWSTGCRF